MKDGMTYAPTGKPAPVVERGEFRFAAAFLDHGHIYGQCNGLLEAGGELVAVYDPQPERVAAFLSNFPGVRVATSFNELLDDTSLHMIAAAAVPNLRSAIGCRVLQAGKDYFTDKTPFTTLEQLATTRETVARTGSRYMVYFSERLHVECAVYAGELIERGEIGDVVQVMGLGPHRLNASTRPPWFFNHGEYGGILCDIGSHQFEQFLYYTGSTSATVTASTVRRSRDSALGELEIFGEAHLVGNTGATNYIRVDWLTPTASRTWGDGRTIILGTKGYIELRKYVEVGRSEGGDQLYLVNETQEQHLSLAGKVGFPFFGQLILDSLQRTERAMTQEHVFTAAELCLRAQEAAIRLPDL